MLERDHVLIHGIQKLTMKLALVANNVNEEFQPRQEARITKLGCYHSPAHQEITDLFPKQVDSLKHYTST